MPVPNPAERERRMTRVMTKAFIELDEIPESCAQCPVARANMYERSFPGGASRWCGIIYSKCPPNGKRADCPIKGGVGRG